MPNCCIHMITESKLLCRYQLEHWSFTANDEYLWGRYLVTQQNSTTQTTERWRGKPLQYVGHAFMTKLKLQNFFFTLIRQSWIFSEENLQMCKILRWRPQKQQQPPSPVVALLFSHSSPSLRSHYWCSHPLSVLLIILLVTIRPAHLITVILIQGPHLPLLWALCLIRKLLSLQQWMRQQQISCDRKAFNDTRSGSGKRCDSVCVFVCVN